MFSSSPPPPTGRKDSVLGYCSYAMICFVLFVQCVSPGVIYCMLLKPFSVYRIINFLIDSFQPSLQLIQPLVIFSLCTLTKIYLLIYSFPSSPPQIILPAPLNSSRRLELLTERVRLCILLMFTNGFINAQQIFRFIGLCFLFRAHTLSF